MISELSELTDEEQRSLLQFIKKCKVCGARIIGTPSKKMCERCANKARKRTNVEWAKKNYTSINYEHDAYVSKRKLYRKEMSVLAAVLISSVSALFPYRRAVAEEINYPSLFSAIAQVESTNGKRSSNVYQITWMYYYDLRRITGEKMPYSSIACSRIMSERAMRIYWAYYTSRWIARGNEVTAEFLAKIHRVGYKGLKTKRKTAEAYWRKVKKHYCPSKE